MISPEFESYHVLYIGSLLNMKIERLQYLKEDLALNIEALELIRDEMANFHEERSSFTIPRWAVDRFDIVYGEE